MSIDDPFTYYRPLHRVAEFVDANIHRKITVADLADVAATQPKSFGAYFKQHVGEPPSVWLQRCKLEEACRLLCESDYTVLELALNLGYSSPRPLERLFCRFLETSPAEWRQRQLDEA